MSQPWQVQLDRIICEQADEVTALRRHLHSHPEPSGAELETSLYLYQRLGELGLHVRMGPQGCGVIADSANLSMGPTEGLLKQRVAFRADIDALRIQDAKQVPYRSSYAGLMHACGHDAHTAIAYGAARALHTLQELGELPWPVV